MVKLGEWSGAELSESDKVSHTGLGDGRVKLAYGMRPDGTMAHIKEVENGRACGCICSACRRELVAYHPERIAHHFKHAANAKRECKYARESALHRYAKQLLEREKKLLLAGLHVEEDGWSRPVIEEQFFTFDSVRLEEHLGEIVPDVVLTKGDRDLYVEIAVTHPCDAEKIQKIERRGVSTLEIDLSGYAYTDNQTEVDDIILFKARRRWVYHRNEAGVRQTLKTDNEARKAAAAERHRKRVLGQLQGWAPRNASDWRDSAYVRNCIEAGLEEYIGLPIEGDRCFRASPRLWQAMLLDGRILRHKAYALRSNGIDLFKAGVWLAENRAVQKGLLIAHNAGDLAIMRGARADYRPPIEIIIEYAQFLAKHGLVHIARSNPYICVISDKLISVVEQAAEERQENASNREYLNRFIRKLGPFVMNEYPLFDFSEWEEVVQDRHGASFSQAVKDPHIFRRMRAGLEAIIEMVEGRKSVANNLLGLPLKQEVKLVSAEIEETRQKTLAQEKLMADGRTDATIKFAEKWLRDGAVWVREKQSIFGGKSAAEYAAESPEALLRIEREIYRLRSVQNRADEDQVQKEQIRQHFQKQLKAVVTQILEEKHRDLFLNNMLPELGMKPVEYVVDQATFERVKLILMMRSAREKRPLVSRRHRRF